MNKTCKSHKLLLVPELIFCNHPKGNGKILLCFCRGNQRDVSFQIGLQKNESLQHLQHFIDLRQNANQQNKPYWNFQSNQWQNQRKTHQSGKEEMVVFSHHAHRQQLQQKDRERTCFPVNNYNHFQNSNYIHLNSNCISVSCLVLQLKLEQNLKTDLEF